jgi:hypothetical protein
VFYPKYNSYYVCVYVCVCMHELGSAYCWRFVLCDTSY